MSTVDRVIEASAPAVDAVVLQVQVGPNVAVARAILGDFVAVADAKRTPGDPFNVEVAENLSVGRALQALGVELENQGLALSEALYAASQGKNA